MSAREAGTLRLLVTLGVAGTLSGVVLVGTHMATRDRIAQNRAEALEAAIGRVLVGTERRETWVLEEGGAVSPLAEGAELPDAVIYACYDAEGQRLGFAVPAEGKGFQDTIKLIYGLVPEERRVVGMEVLESLETPGLGDKIIKDQAFVGAFRDLSVDPEIVATKKGATKPNEIDAITGATISSKAVVNIINAGNSTWLEPLDEGGS